MSDDTLQSQTFGVLSWSEEHAQWEGAVGFGGARLTLSIHFDAFQTNEQHRRQAVELAAELFQKLTPDHEATLRRKAAEEVVEAVYSQGGEPEPGAATALSDGMRPVAVSFLFLTDEGRVSSGSLEYNEERHWRGHPLAVTFGPDLQFEEVQILGL